MDNEFTSVTAWLQATGPYGLVAVLGWAFWRVNEKKDRELKALHEKIVVLAEAQPPSSRSKQLSSRCATPSTTCADGDRESGASHARVQVPLHISPAHCREFPRTSRVL